MQKKVLSEIALYYGDVAMPKDWDIDRDKLSKRHFTISNYKTKIFHFQELGIC